MNNELRFSNSFISDQDRRDFKFDPAFLVNELIQRFTSPYNDFDHKFFWGTDEYVTNHLKIPPTTLKRAWVTLEKLGRITRVYEHIPGFDGKARRIYPMKLNKLQVDLIKLEMIEIKSNKPADLVKTISKSDWVVFYLEKLLHDKFVEYLKMYQFHSVENERRATVEYWTSLTMEMISNMGTKLQKYGYEIGSTPIGVSQVLQLKKVH